MFLNQKLPGEGPGLRISFGIRQRRLIKPFGSSVRRESKNREMTQEQLAEAVDVTIRAVQKIQAGGVTILLRTVLKIQKAVGCISVS